MNPTNDPAHQPLAVEAGASLPNPLAVGTSVQWIDPRTGEPDPTPGRVTRIMPDPSEAYPIEVQFTDGLRGRYARSDLKVVAL